MALFKYALKVWHLTWMKSFILGVVRLIPDDIYLQLVAQQKLGYAIHLKEPRTFNEKLNWLKLHDRNPLYTKLADKLAVKKIVADVIGEQYVVRNLGNWDTFDEIDFSALPHQFVLKCTHDSSGAIICRDKSTFNNETARKRINNALRLNYFYACREWPYKNIPRQIIADELLDDHSGKELNDYKFWCFGGVPMYMYCTVKTKRKEIYENFYDMNFNIIKINHGFSRRVPEFEKPAAFELMKELAGKLAEGIPFVRVDFFYVNGKVYFGEYTFYDWAGLQPFETFEMDLKLGELLVLPKKENFSL